jgi:hypothetical protein
MLVIKSMIIILNAVGRRILTLELNNKKLGIEISYLNLIG